MKTHDNAPLTPSPLTFTDRMHLTAVCIMAAVVLALIVWGVLEGRS